MLCGLVLLTQLLCSLSAVKGQGLNDGGVLGGQTCDAVRLQAFDELLALATEYSGGRGGGGKGGSGGRRGRRLLQGLADAPTLPDGVHAAASSPAPPPAPVPASA